MVDDWVVGVAMKGVKTVFISHKERKVLKTILCNICGLKALYGKLVCGVC